MEVVGSCRWLNDLHIGVQQDISIVVGLTISGHELILVTKKQESLSSAWWVLRSISIISMRQESNQSILDVPLDLSWNDKLIDNDLGSICKVTELRFPKSKGIGMGLCISKLKSKNCKLRQMWVTCHECSFSLLLLFSSTIYWVIVTHLILVPNVSVSVGECSSLDILSWNSDMIAILDKSSEGQSLCSSPINTLAVLNGFVSSLEYLLDQSMEFGILGQIVILAPMSLSLETSTPEILASSLSKTLIFSHSGVTQSSAL